MTASLPNSVKQVALFFERLPGIGQKTANRLAFYLLRMPEQDLREFAQHIAEIKSRTVRCRTCNNLTETELCSICSDKERDHTQITVVEDVIDLLSFETGGIYKGVYHVLHGKIDPLNHVAPEDIFIDSLLSRVRRSDVTEVILAMNPDMEGEATAMYIRNALKDIRENHGKQFTVTRLGYGLPIGGNLEYADYMTLKKALENRSDFNS
ncbi:MAG: recombination mediator RecR [Patescibacteria group bacterium]